VEKAPISGMAKLAPGIGVGQPIETRSPRYRAITGGGLVESALSPESPVDVAPATEPRTDLSGLVALRVVAPVRDAKVLALLPNQSGHERQKGRAFFKTGSQSRLSATRQFAS
jgi:hypothetical protein